MAGAHQPVVEACGAGVLVVEDSGVERRFLRTALAAEPGVEVVAEARNVRDALALVDRLRPAAILLDLDLPGDAAIELIERVMASIPTPILVYTVARDDERAARALAAGAIEVIVRPRASEVDRSEYAEAVRRGVRVAVRVRVITHPLGRLKARGFAAVRADGDDRAHRRPTVVAPQVPTGHRTVDLVAIGTSTGGPQALAQLLAGLPADFSPAIVVAQHMADGFVDGLAAWLASVCPLPVVIGQRNGRLLPGTVTLAPGGHNLVVRDHMRLDIETPPPSQFHVPGVDALFTSVAEHVGPRAIGVLLTGMGRDGALGLKAMREAGAITIGQDEESSAVWGMPGAAAALGAVQRQLPLNEIADALVAILRGDPFGDES
ncbi:MAG: response regulator [Acidothermus sp.]|nr:response regulator [Acidothermus sp.]MCL6537695.1 response regulator [Acidothermus sp.]